MSRKLYIECLSGISGDMAVAMLLDLGADRQVLTDVLSSLSLEEFKTEISRVKKSGIDCCDFNVILKEDNHDHDVEYLYGSNSLGTEHSHNHGHEHHHPHTHRGINEIAEIINTCSATEKAKKIALNIFDIIADAEAKAHGLDKAKVHFHEVGAADSIIDVISLGVCMDNLGIDEVIVPKLYEGTGTVRTQHGIMPVPVPAVVNIAAAHGIKISITNNKGEYVTPTGAAFIAAVKTSDKLPAEFTIIKTGLGAGKRSQHGTGFVRGMLIE